VQPRLTHRSAWLDDDGALPVIDGTLIRLQADHQPSHRAPGHGATTVILSWGMNRRSQVSPATRRYLD
jgi:hypothetical protein